MEVSREGALGLSSYSTPTILNPCLAPEDNLMTLSCLDSSMSDKEHFLPSDQGVLLQSLFELSTDFDFTDQISDIMRFLNGPQSVASALPDEAPMQRSFEILKGKEASQNTNEQPSTSELEYKKRKIIVLNTELPPQRSDELARISVQAKHTYVCVRAKKGQTTNKHSLTERARREIINEKMKILEDLVPGCKKVNPKALILNEIISYVLSLQQQVEHLSMKLATLDLQFEQNIDTLLQKNMYKFE